MGTAWIVTPFANINKVKSYQHKYGKSLVIHYTNMQGLGDKVSFAAAPFSKDVAEDVLLVAQSLWKEDLLAEDGTLDLVVPSPIESEERG
jgi:hypothetical protein